MPQFPRFKPGGPAIVAIVAIVGGADPTGKQNFRNYRNFRNPGASTSEIGRGELSQLSQLSQHIAPGALDPAYLNGLATVMDADSGAIGEPQRQTQPGPPSPADITERAAIIAEGDHCDRATADARALAEYGIASWPALAEAQREQILAELARLPLASSDQGRRLLNLTRRFLDTEHWRTAVALGWDLVELFGIHPHTPLTCPDSRGLVPRLALSADSGARLEAIESAGAVFRTKSGAPQTYTLGMPAMDAAVLWWECVAIIGDNDIQSNREDA